MTRRFPRLPAYLGNVASRAGLLAAGLLLLTALQPAYVQAQLTPTAHPPLPTSASDLWLVPAATDRAARALSTYDSLVDGVRRYQDADYAAALALVMRPGLRTTALGDYAAYYTGLSQLRLGRFADGFHGTLSRELELEG